MNIDAIVKELEDIAADAQAVKYESAAQTALLRGVAAIKTLQGRLLIQEGEALFYSLRSQPIKQAGNHK